MHSIDFNELPEISKNRFVAATRSPIARFPSSATSSTGWGCLLAAALVPLLPFLIGSFTAAKGNPTAPLIAILSFLVVLAGLGIARANAVKAAHPYVLGTYLFPTQIVIAESKVLALYPLAELIDVAIVHRYVNGGYQQSTLTCTFKTGPAAVLVVSSIQESHRVRAALAQGQETMFTALSRGDYEPLRALDPLFEAQVTSFAKVSEPGPLVQALPKWTEAGPRFGIALGTSLVLTGFIVLAQFIINAASAEPDPPAKRSPPAAQKPPATPPASTPTAKKKPGAR